MEQEKAFQPIDYLISFLREISHQAMRFATSATIRVASILITCLLEHGKTTLMTGNEKAEMLFLAEKAMAERN